MAAGMEVEQGEAELLAALHLVEEGGAGLLEPGGIRVAEVDQVAVVGKDLLGAEAMFPAGAAKGLDGSLFEGLGSPLALVLGEQGEGVGADLDGTKHGLVGTAGGADVGTQVFHLASP
ncbi:hypothetical protein Q427_20700 [Halomonas sp. BC04]|nr:hypothetical protein Q427_20700 [Halomonas sp. BC04]